MGQLKYLTVDHLPLKDIIRIFSKITVDPVRECWIWTGYRSPGGYGVVNYDGRKELAHRVMYAWAVGPLERGHGRDIPQLDHVVCDNPPCCNPAHLLLVSQFANFIRSNSPAAINARKTHCVNGHPLPAEPNKFGQRDCQICNDEYYAKRHPKRTHCTRGHLLPVGKGNQPCYECRASNGERVREYKRTWAREKFNGPNRARLLDEIRKRRDSDEYRAKHRSYQQQRRGMHGQR